MVLGLGWERCLVLFCFLFVFWSGIRQVGLPKTVRLLILVYYFYFILFYFVLYCMETYVFFIHNFKRVITNDLIL